MNQKTDHIDREIEETSKAIRSVILQLKKKPLSEQELNAIHDLHFSGSLVRKKRGDAWVQGTNYCNNKLEDHDNEIIKSLSDRKYVILTSNLGIDRAFFTEHGRNVSWVTGRAGVDRFGKQEGDA